MSLVTALHDLSTRVATEIKSLRAEIPEAARDAVAGSLVAGDGVSITVDDTANTVTISTGLDPRVIAMAVAL